MNTTMKTTMSPAMNKAFNLALRCDCGDPIEACISCAAPRCTTCEPYVSDDCSVVFASAS
jgi:hypothetical protein